MTEPSALDTAHARMQADLDDDAARLAFYGTLADTELFLLLAEEPAPGSRNLTPELLELEDERFALAFDSEERLSDFAEGTAAPYAALPGRAIAALLAGQASEQAGGQAGDTQEPPIGLGLNLGVAPSSILIPPAGLSWLARALSDAPSLQPARLGALSPPSPAARALAGLLGRRLARAGLAGIAAHLAHARLEDATTTDLLVITGAPQAAETRLAGAVREAAAFHAPGLEIAVIFAAADSDLARRAAAHGLTLHLPQPAPRPVPAAPKAPGMDPDDPPILK